MLGWEYPSQHFCVRIRKTSKRQWSLCHPRPRCHLSLLYFADNIKKSANTVDNLRVIPYNKEKNRGWLL